MSWERRRWHNSLQWLTFESQSIQLATSLGVVTLHAS